MTSPKTRAANLSRDDVQKRRLNLGKVSFSGRTITSGEALKDVEPFDQEERREEKK